MIFQFSTDLQLSWIKLFFDQIESSFGRSLISAAINFIVEL